MFIYFFSYFNFFFFLETEPLYVAQGGPKLSMLLPLNLWSLGSQVYVTVSSQLKVCSQGSSYFLIFLSLNQPTSHNAQPERSPLMFSFSGILFVLWILLTHTTDNWITCLGEFSTGLTIWKSSWFKFKGVFEKQNNPTLKTLPIKGKKMLVEISNAYPELNGYEDGKTWLGVLGALRR